MIMMRYSFVFRKENFTVIIRNGYYYYIYFNKIYNCIVGKVWDTSGQGVALNLVLPFSAVIIVGEWIGVFALKM